MTGAATWSAYLSASPRTVLVLEYALLWARVQELPGDKAEASDENQRFVRFEARHPELAALAKSIQFDAFDRVNAL